MADRWEHGMLTVDYESNIDCQTVLWQQYPLEQVLVARSAGWDEWDNRVEVTEHRRQREELATRYREFVAELGLQGWQAVGCTSSTTMFKRLVR